MQYYLKHPSEVCGDGGAPPCPGDEHYTAPMASEETIITTGPPRAPGPAAEGHGEREGACSYILRT